MGRLGQGLRPLRRLSRSLVGWTPHLDPAAQPDPLTTPGIQASPAQGGLAAPALTPAAYGASQREPHPLSAHAAPESPVGGLVASALTPAVAEAPRTQPHSLVAYGGGAPPARGLAMSALDSASLRPRAESWREETYARGSTQYSKVARALRDTHKAHLMMDLYDDMVMDGVLPDFQTWHALIVGCKRQRRLDDTLFFFSQMKAQGKKPDIVLYNCVIDACGVARHVNHAFKVAEEMEANGLKPTERTFVALLSACGVAGRVEEALGVVQRMKSLGLKPDIFCYSALISAYKNALPLLPEAQPMIFELLEQARKLGEQELSTQQRSGPASAGGADEMAEEDPDHEDADVSNPYDNVEEGSLVQGFTQDKRQVAFRAAMRAMVYFRNVDGAKRVLELLREDGMEPDIYMQVLFVQACIVTKDMETALTEYYKLFETNKDFKPGVRLQVAMIAGAIKTFKPGLLDVAKQLVAELEQRGFFLSTLLGGYLLRLASLKYIEDLSCANVIFDHILRNFQTSRPIFPHIPSIIAYIEGLLARQVPPDDERLVAARDLVTRLRRSFRGDPGHARDAVEQHRSPATPQDEFSQ